MEKSSLKAASLLLPCIRQGKPPLYLYEAKPGRNRVSCASSFSCNLIFFLENSMQILPPSRNSCFFCTYLATPDVVMPTNSHFSSRFRHQSVQIYSTFLFSFCPLPYIQRSYIVLSFSFSSTDHEQDLGKLKQSNVPP
jgi:hypothetical protein